MFGDKDRGFLWILKGITPFLWRSWKSWPSSRTAQVRLSDPMRAEATASQAVAECHRPPPAPVWQWCVVLGENSQNSAVTTEGSVLTWMDQERSRARQLRICDFSRILEVQEVDLLRGFSFHSSKGIPWLSHLPGLGWTLQALQTHPGSVTWAGCNLAADVTLRRERQASSDIAVAQNCWYSQNWMDEC